ncbi:histidinol-phosphatase HisJ [Bacillaceae bacterium Marseille-Q3522]|nr:histidinol-phosphatase HisJ [Bacillaceae bacterium Marseille-Q3522]
MKRDGHIHTPFCPHGTDDPFEDYVEAALSFGFTELTFTEHCPLPHGFTDPVPEKDSAISFSEFPGYIAEMNRIKEKYNGQITIHTGLEVDFIEGFEKEIRETLQIVGPFLGDSVLSVHFLKNDHHYSCLDYSPEIFEEIISEYGSVEAVYDRYFQTLLSAVNADLGPFKPKRIGHLTLIKKFQKRFPTARSYRDEIITVLDAIKSNGLELDYNGAGLRKPFCGETYPPNWVVKEATARNIPLVYGSDAHEAKAIGQGYTEISKQLHDQM